MAEQSVFKDLLSQGFVKCMLLHLVQWRYQKSRNRKKKLYSQYLKQQEKTAPSSTGCSLLLTADKHTIHLVLVLRISHRYKASNLINSIQSIKAYFDNTVAQVKQLTTALLLKLSQYGHDIYNW